MTAAATTDAPLDHVFTALDAAGCAPQQRAGYLAARCPAHDDRTPSLSASPSRHTPGKIVLTCHAGCDDHAILDALSLTVADLYAESPPRQHRNGTPQPRIVAEYVYRHADGTEAFRKLRYQPKAFRIRRGDGAGGWLWSLGDVQPMLYNLPDVTAAVAAGRTIHVCEGEKDADRLTALGHTATCNFDGAAATGQRCKWRDSYTTALTGAHVVIIADDDEAGRAHGTAAADALHGHAASVHLTLPATGEGTDLCDHLDAGHSLDGLSPLHHRLDRELADTSDDRAGPAEEPTERAQVTSLATVTPERVEWLWPGRLPAGKIVTLDGDPSLGKSTLALDLAAHLSTGSPWPDATHCPTGDTVILSAEDGLADTIRPRLDAAGADPSRVHALTGITTPDGDGGSYSRAPTLADITQISRTVENTGARLLIIDVLMAYLPGKVDSHRDQDVRTILARLASLGDSTGCCILLLRHLNKTGGGSAVYRGGGSIGIIGAARGGFTVARDPDDETQLVLSSTKSNLAQTPASLTYRLESTPGSHVAHIVWGGESAHTADSLLSSGSSEERTEQDDAAAFIIEHLENHGGAALAREVQAEGRKKGFSKTAMHRGAAKAGVQKEKTAMRGPWRWHHPDDAPRFHEGSEGFSSRDTESSEPS